MGYYSTVRLLAKKKVAKKIFKAIKDTGSPFNEIKVSPSGQTYYFEAYTKWYEYASDGYPDVNAVMGVLDAVDEEKDGDHDYTYIRVGEEDGDIDRRGFGFGYLDEGEVYSDGRSDEIDAWCDVDENGKTIKSTPVERLTPFWEEFKKKAELFGIKITKNLPEIIK